mmetsp:Transcript_119854/g.208049  ORF Transcript_119854/g.208049 Transcript_119854/m.208049 type:complete len:92 (-) Transcript_119854:1711-1986(-)
MQQAFAGRYVDLDAVWGVLANSTHAADNADYLMAVESTLQIVEEQRRTGRSPSGSNPWTSAACKELGSSPSAHPEAVLRQRKEQLQHLCRI